MSFLRDEYSKLAGKGLSLDLNEFESQDNEDSQQRYEPIQIKKRQVLKSYAKEILTDWFNSNLEVSFSV